MAGVDWKTLQHPVFQVLWCSTPTEDRPAPLHIRPFTSDSYRTIKERERRKKCRHINANSRQRSIAQSQEGLSELGQSAAVLKMPRMHSAASNVISASDSGDLRRELAVTQDHSKTQPDDGLQHYFSSSGAPSENILEGRSSSGIQCLTSLPSLTMSPVAYGLDLEVVTGAEHESELSHDRGSDACALPPDDVRMITARVDDAGSCRQQPKTRSRSDAELARATSSLTPVENSASKRHPGSCKQLTESHGNRSPSLVPQELNSEMATAEISLKYLSTEHLADESHAAVLLDEPSCTSGVALTIRPRTSEAESQRNNSIERKSRPQSPWTSQQDGLLLHLRDTAQLNWRNIQSYFPGFTLNAVKSRYKHLNEGRTIRQIIGDEPKSQLHVRRRTTYLAASTSPTAAKTCRLPSVAKSRKRRTRTLVEHRRTPRRQHVTKQAINAKDAGLRTAPTHKDACQQTSRSGRLIRHPFRHRRSEGYL